MQRRQHIEIKKIKYPENERLRLLPPVQSGLEHSHRDPPEPRPYAEHELSNVSGAYRPITDLEDSGAEYLPVAMTPAGTRGQQSLGPELRLDTDEGSRVPLRAYLSYSWKDTRYRNSFLPCLSVMMKKKLITHWHDGMIEPGKELRREIEEQLQRMDIFIGLLTVDFLACSEIEEVPLAAARARLEPGNEGRDFRFILIQVDDVPLKGLDLAAYKVLTPGGRPVKKHPSLRDGFIAAQRELEELIDKRMK